MVKNVEHRKRTIPSPKKGDKHSCHFQRGFPPVPHAPFFFFFFTTKTRDQASQQGGVKGRELELDISILAIANFKNL